MLCDPASRARDLANIRVRQVAGLLRIVHTGERTLYSLEQPLCLQSGHF